MIAAVVLSGVASIFYLRPDTPTIDAATAKQSEVDSSAIAVLPFADLSPAGDQTWFADGISEEILNVLAKADGMKVASRTASFRYRGSDIDIREIARNLDVSLVLEGSVRAQGDQLRITAQLINAADGFHVWSHTFDGQKSDVFAFQDEIATSIARELFGEVGVKSLPEKRFDGTNSPEAHNAYLRGISKIMSVDFGSYGQVVPDFEEAIAIDPNYVDAWAGLAFARREVRILNNLPPEIDDAMVQALRLDADNVMAIWSLASYNLATRRWLEAEQLFRRAIQLDPDYAPLRIDFAIFLRRTGRVERALQELYQAQALGSDYADLVSLIVNTNAYLGRFAEARRVYEEERERVGQEAMRGSEAYFVSLLADGMEAEARAFAPLVTSPVASMRIAFFISRLDGNPDAGRYLIDATKARVESAGAIRFSDVENVLMAGDIALAREFVSNVLARGWSIPPRMFLYASNEIDPRYLPYRANLLLLAEELPEAMQVFKVNGMDLLAMAREKGNLN